MRFFLSLLLLLFIETRLVDAQINLDSLEQELKITKGIHKVNTLGALAEASVQLNPDTALFYARKGEKLGRELNDSSGLLFCLFQKSRGFYALGKYQLAISTLEEILPSYKKVKNWKQVVLALKLLGNCNERQGQYEDALSIQKEALEIAQSIQFEKGIAQILNNIAILFMRQGNYNQSIATYQQVIQINDLNQTDHQFQANTFRNIGIVYKRKGDYELALEYYYEALKINEVINNPRRLAENWNSIATILSELERTDQSFSAYKQALNYIDTRKPSKLQKDILNNMGTVYLRNHQLDSALVFYKQSLTISKGLEGFLNLGDLFYNMGSIYFEKKEYTKALTYLEQSYDAEPDSPDVQNQARVQVLIGRIFLEQSDYEKSLSYLTKGLKKSDRLGLKKIKSDAFKYLAEVYQNLNEPEKVVYYQEQYFLMKDSLFNLEKAAQIEQLIFAHNETKNQREITNLKQETTIQKLKQERLWLGLFASAIIGLLLFFFQRKRTRHAQKQQGLLTIQKNWLELQSLRNQFKPHFVFNALSSIQNFLIVKDSEKALSYIQDFAQLMREMLENTEKDDILLEDEIVFLNRYLKIEQLRTDHCFDYEIIQEKGLEYSEIFIPNLLLQTIVENAIWHGVIPRKEKGLISLRFKKEKQWLKIEIEDNGVGRDYHKKDKHVSKGLNLLRQRIEALNKKKDRDICWHIEDLNNEQGNPSGTKVSIDYLVEVD